MRSRSDCNRIRRVVRPHPRNALAAGALLLIGASTSRLWADGGTILQHAEKGQFAITVFVSPSPPGAGPVDLSVLVQSGQALAPVLDANVVLTLTKGDSRIETRATRDQAQNKLLYASTIPLNEQGAWHYKVAVNDVEVSGLIDIAPAQPKLAAYWIYLALPFVVIALFALQQQLKRSRKNLLPGAKAGLFAHHD